MHRLEDTNVLDSVIELFSTDLIHVPHSEDTNRDGFSTPGFGTPRDIEGSVRPQLAVDFEVGQHGRIDAEELYLVVKDEYDVRENDRIVFEGDHYRVTEPQRGYVANFVIYTLSPDGRGEHDDSEYDPDTGEDEEDPDYYVG